MVLAILLKQAVLILSLSEEMVNGHGTELHQLSGEEGK